MKQKSNTGKPESIILERRFVAEGEIIIREGSIGENAFLIQSGLVSVFTEKDGEIIEFDRVGPGQIVGEMALIKDCERTASVKALDDCNLIVITRHVLKQKLESSDPTIRAIVPMLMSRVMKTNSALLNQSQEIDDLIKTANMIYENINGSLDKENKTAFQTNVLPSLEEFLKNIKTFNASLKKDA
jgi:CRP-like cAMP-binding protein